MVGLPYRATTADVLEFFSGFPVLERSIEFGRDERGRPSGEGWVCFTTLEAADAAVSQRNKAFMGDRYVNLYLA